MRVAFLDFAPMHNELHEQLVEKFNKVLAANYFILGHECEEFEKKFPFPKVAMLGMILSAPFRSRRGKDGLNTFEDIQKYVDELNGKLK